MPAQLPERIAFVNIDCGFGGDPEQHAAILVHILEHVYPRLSSGAICSFFDYVDPAVLMPAIVENPGVKLGCDRFFAGKPERIDVLYGGEYGHAYARKH